MYSNNNKKKVGISGSKNNNNAIHAYSQGVCYESKNNERYFKKEFKEFDATIVFNTPSYKVWVGNYKTRIEAERNLKLLVKKYPNAFIIKPSKL